MDIKILIKRNGPIKACFLSSTWDIPDHEFDTLEELNKFLKTHVIRTDNMNQYINFYNTLMREHEK